MNFYLLEKQPERAGRAVTEREIQTQSSPAGRDTERGERKSKKTRCTHGGGQGDPTGNCPGTDAYL